MTNNGTILNDSLAHIQHLQAWDLAMKKRFGDLDLDKLLIYFIDTVDASALPYLAEQFDVLGYKGYRLAQNEADQRAIIKKSIELHRFKGTLWAVEEAVKSIGYGDAVIEEHVEKNWWWFRVTLDIATHQLSEAELADLIKMIQAYKNARSYLVDVSFTIEFIDEVINITDEFIDGQGSTDLDDMTFGGEFRHNGLHLRDGSQNYSTDTDVLDITII